MLSRQYALIVDPVQCHARQLAVYGSRLYCRSSGARFLLLSFKSQLCSSPSSTFVPKPQCKAHGVHTHACSSTLHGVASQLNVPLVEHLNIISAHSQLHHSRCFYHCSGKLCFASPHVSLAAFICLLLSHAATRTSGHSMSLNCSQKTDQTDRQ